MVGNLIIAQKLLRIEDLQNWNPSSGPKVWHKSQNEISDDNKDKQMQKPPIRVNKQCSIGASL